MKTIGILSAATTKSNWSLGRMIKTHTTDSAGNFSNRQRQSPAMQPPVHFRQVIISIG